MPPLKDLTPQAFDPADGLDQLSNILSEISQEETEQEQQKSNGPSFKRKQTILSSKQESKAAVLKRQVKGAKAIAATCQWILKQVEIKRIRRTFGDDFEEDHFSDTHLTNIEIKWLEDNDSIEKVLSNSCHAYATAPQWEAYPKSILSEADLQKIEEHKQQNIKDLEEADELGRTLLVRIGENAGDNHLVEYGKGSAAWVKDQINKRRVSKKKTTTASKTPEAAAAAATNASSSTRAEESMCAVEECTEKPIEGSCTDAECSSRRYCDLHLSHTSHSNHRLRVLDPVRVK